jgi:hypothetical protein
VKDEEIQNLSKDVRARDLTIRQIAEKLTETASAAKAAASAAFSIDEERKKLCAEIELLKKDTSSKLQSSLLKVKIAYFLLTYLKLQSVIGRFDMDDQKF